MKTRIAVPVLISGLLLAGCDQATRETAKDKVRSFAEVQLYESRIAMETEARRKELELLKQVNDFESFKQADESIKDLQASFEEEKKKLPNPGRLSYQDQQKVDPEVEQQFIAVIGELQTERTRVRQIEGVSEYQNQQRDTRRLEELKTLYEHLDGQSLTDKEAITKDPEAYLASINNDMDDWRGISSDLSAIKDKLDQYLTLNPESAEGYLALAVYYSLKSAFNRTENTANARKICTYLIKNESELHEVHVVQAGLQLRTDNYSLARDYLNKAGAAGVDTFWYHYFLADVLIQEGKQQAGETKLRALLEQDWRKSQQAYVYSRLSFLKLNQGKLDESLALHEKAVGLHPGFHWRHGNYGFRLLKASGAIEHASRQLETARAIQSYGQLNRLAQDILFVKWANAKTGNMNPGWAPDLAAFKPTEEQMKKMMVRVGEFRHGQTVNALVKVLQKQGISIDTQDSTGRTAMHLAARNGNINTLEALHRQGASLEITNEAGYTPLLWGLQFDRADSADQLITLGADVNYEIPNIGATALQMAAYGGHHGLVERLITKGVDVNYVARSKLHDQTETPLIVAVLNGDKKMVEILLAAGADQSVTVMGRTLPEAAKELGHSDLVALLKR